MLSSPQISVDEFGKVTLRRKLSRRPPLPRDHDVIPCSKPDCVNPLHRHNTPRHIDISDNDSDLLISINDSEMAVHGKVNLPPVSGQETDVSFSRELRVSSDSGRGSEETPKLSSEESPACRTANVTSPVPETSAGLAVESPCFLRVGFSQCKSAKSKTRTRRAALPPDAGSNSFFSDPYITDEPQENKKEPLESIKRKVVFESPRTPSEPVYHRKRIGKLPETPESGPSVTVYAENTPEHLVGVGMVTRRLRKVWGHVVPESLDQS